LGILRQVHAGLLERTDHVAFMQNVAGITAGEREQVVILLLEFRKLKVRNISAVSLISIWIRLADLISIPCRVRQRCRVISHVSISVPALRIARVGTGVFGIGSNPAALVRGVIAVLRQEQVDA